MRTSMKPDTLVVHMKQLCQPILVTFDIKANILLSPVGDVTYLRQHLALMMWINELVMWTRQRTPVLLSWDLHQDMNSHFQTLKGCFIHPLDHPTSYWLLGKEAQAYRNCSSMMGGHSFKKLPENFAKGWPKWFTHSPVPSIMPQWVMPLEITPLAKNNSHTCPAVLGGHAVLG